MTTPALDIILPCYNPVSGWAENVIQSYKEISTHIGNENIQLILVNDGSSKGISDDDINKIKQSIQLFSYISYPVNKGKGAALRMGVARSTAPVCIYTDVDFPYTTDSFLTIWQLLEAGKTDIAAGIKNENYYEHVPGTRRIISKVLRACTKFILRLKVSDTQCGLKGFNARGRELFLSTTINRYLFDLEFIFIASRNKNMVIRPVPIQLKENIHFSSMRFRILITEGFNFMKLFFKSL